MNELRVSLMLLALCLGCTDTVGSTSGASATDASARTDRGTGVCVENSDCDDGLHCTGDERCAPGDPRADRGGCVRGTPPCPEDRCNETSKSCRDDCDRNPDMDGDGERARACGGSDCDDNDRTRFPNNPEVCAPPPDGGVDDHDEDCDPETFANSATRDGDRDGDGRVSVRCFNVDRSGSRSGGDDCDDSDPTIRPRQADDNCNGRDDDCDGMVDEDSPRREYCRDNDNDGVGSRASGAMTACARPSGFVERCDDCDDGSRARSPVLAETCDGVDNNCNNRVDDGLPTVECCRDEDNDGFSNPRMRTSGCRACATGWRQCGGFEDCCDSDARAYPGQTRPSTSARNRCGGYDYNCDGRDTPTCLPGTPCNCDSCGGLTNVAPGFDFPCGSVRGQAACGMIGRNLPPTLCYPQHTTPPFNAPTFTVACL